MAPSHTYFSTLARYNVWATRRLLDAVAAVPDGEYRRDVGLFFKSIYGTLNHLLVGEYMLWQRRFAQGISPKVVLSEEVEPSREQLAQRLLEGAARWQPLIESWPAERFEGELNYTTMRGHTVSLLLALTLAHVIWPRYTPLRPDHGRAHSAGPRWPGA